MSKIHDISVTITPQLPVWLGDPPVIIERVSKIEAGDRVNVTRLELGAHTGTHLDAPYHFIAGGNTIERLSLEVLIGPARVVELPGSCDLITAATLEPLNLEAGLERVLFKTRNSRLWADKGAEFQTDFVALSGSAAEYLVRLGVKLVGVDYLSVAPYADVFPTHLALLGAGVVVLEGCDLSAVAPGRYTLCCLPIKIAAADGAPARAVLIEED